MKVWVGIDPGDKGSLCAVSEDNKVLFIPTTNESEIVEWLNTLNSTDTIVMCMIEDVHSIYGVSAKSNFNFGFNVGKLHGIIRSLNLPLDLVQPKAWQKHFGVKATGKDIKKEVASIAERLHPGLPIYGPKGGLLDGRSDAYLIAKFAQFKFH